MTPPKPPPAPPETETDELTRLRLENTALRALLVKAGKCAYGHRSESGACALGYPGCACADDLLAFLSDYPAPSEATEAPETAPF